MEDSKDRLDPLVKLGILLRCEGEVGGFSACFHIYIYRERERYKSPAHSSTGVRFQSGYAQGGSKISLLTSPEVDFDLEPRAPDQILEKQADRANKGRQSGVAADIQRSAPLEVLRKVRVIVLATLELTFKQEGAD
jgi:hypothetical protein